MYVIYFIYVFQKAAAVPQTAMMIAETRTILSNIPYRPVSAIFAEIGPITQMINAENEPRNAIMEPNSGIRIDIPTDVNVNRTLSVTINICLGSQIDHLEDVSRLEPVLYCNGCGSKPSIFSKTTLI
jgi:hypothetical protein